MRDFKHVKKVVIKVGTSSLTLADGKLDHKKIKYLIKTISRQAEAGYQMMLVSSGAVGAGIGKLEVDKRPDNIALKQMLASVGQVSLMHLYETLFCAHDHVIAQLLLAKSDFDNSKRLANLKQVCDLLLDRKIIPIVNENDAVVTDELKVGDNDRLSALFAKLVGADLLILLSDIDGLYEANPRYVRQARLIDKVSGINQPVIDLQINGVEKKVTNQELVSMSAGDGSDFGTGGMLTKLQAAKIATAAGIDMVITNGCQAENITEVLAGRKVGTWFTKKEKR